MGNEILSGIPLQVGPRRSLLRIMHCLDQFGLPCGNEIHAGG